MYLRVLRDVLRGIYPMFRWLSNTCIAEMYSVVFDTYRKRILEYHGIRLNTEAQRGAYSGLSEYVKIRLYCENTSEYVRIFGREYNGIWEEKPLIPPTLRPHTHTPALVNRRHSHHAWQDPSF